MKRRKPLARRTPMKPSARGLTRSRLKRMGSVKKRELAIEAAVVDAYRKLFPKCQNCGRKPATDIHEIFGEGRRHVARTHRSCILHLCRPCHHLMQYSPKPMQLAVKFTSDRKGFDLREFNELSPGPPVTMAQVDDCMPEVR